MGTFRNPRRFTVEVVRQGDGLVLKRFGRDFPMQFVSPGRFSVALPRGGTETIAFGLGAGRPRRLPADERVGAGPGAPSNRDARSDLACAACGAHSYAPASCPRSAQPSPPADRIAPALRQIVAGPERYAVERHRPDRQPARRIAALEPAIPPVATQRRVVLVAGLDGTRDSTRAVLDVLTWRLRQRHAVEQPPPLAGRRRAVRRCPTGAIRTTRRSGSSRRTAIAFPPDKGYYDAPEFREARYLWRWVSMLGPDLVIEVRRGGTLEWRANALGTGRVAEQRRRRRRLARRRARHRQRRRGWRRSRPCR